MRLARGLARVWFAPMPPERVALARILIGTYALSRVFANAGYVLTRAEERTAMVRPVGLMRLVERVPPSEALLALLALAVVSGAAFVAGFRFRWLAPPFALALLALCSYRNSFGMLYHTDQLLTLHVIVLALAPAADAWSIDARRGARRGVAPAQPAWRYGWPICMLCALTVSIYWLAAVAKLSAHGLSWMAGEPLRAQIGKDALRKQLLGKPLAPLATPFLRQPWLAMLAGIGTMILELAAPLYLFGRRSRQVWALSAFLMHWGVLAIMGITFRYQLTGIAFVSFFESERAARLLRAKLRSAGSRRAAPGC